MGYRDGSRRKNKITTVELCRGDCWYGEYAGPFIKALQTSDNKLDIQFRSYMPADPGRRKITAVKVDHSWSFIMDISSPKGNYTGPEAFEWRHKQNYRDGNSEKYQEGYILVQLSTKQAVARMSVSGSMITGDLEIEYFGGGEVYGGFWKLIALITGMSGANNKQGFFWSRR